MHKGCLTFSHGQMIVSQPLSFSLVHACRKNSLTQRENFFCFSLSRANLLSSLSSLSSISPILSSYTFSSLTISRGRTPVSRGTSSPGVREPLCCAVFLSSSYFPLSVAHVSTHIPLSLSPRTIKRGESVNI